MIFTYEVISVTVYVCKFLLSTCYNTYVNITLKFNVNLVTYRLGDLSDNSQTPVSNT